MIPDADAVVLMRDRTPFKAELIDQLPNALLTPHVGFVCEPVFKNFDNGVAECRAD